VKLYYLSLSAELLKNIRRIDQMVSLHWGLSLAGATSCVYLSWLVFYCLHLCLSAFYYHVDVIAILEIDIGLIRRFEVNCP